MTQWDAQCPSCGQWRAGGAECCPSPRLTVPGLYWCLDDAGDPYRATDHRVWFDLMCDQERRTLELDRLGNGLTVSTVFLGIDGGAITSPGGPPRLWETVVMGSEDWAREDVPFDCAQHATRADAEAGHALIVARVRGLPHPLRGRR